jgi:BA14K-like protein
MTRLLWCFAVVLALMAKPALSTPKDYCEAYALDFADKVAKEDAAWPVRHGNALESCLLQFQPPKKADAKPAARKQAKVASKPPVQRAKLKAVAKPEVAAVEEPIEAEPLPEPAVIVAPDIEPPARKSAQSSKPAEPAKSKTLLAKLFPGKAKPADGEKLEPGSTAWLDYCENKYASFNRATGTYTSFKGIARKCLVTD